MRKFGLICLVFLLVGCGSFEISYELNTGNDSTVVDFDTGVNDQSEDHTVDGLEDNLENDLETEEVEDLEAMRLAEIQSKEKREALLAKYKEWGIPDFENYGKGYELDSIFKNPWKDCIIWNSDPRFEEGDLLSTMVAYNQFFTDNFNIDVYANPDYLLRLDYLAATDFKSKYGENYVMHSVCNVADGVDVLAGGIDVLMGDYAENINGLYVLNKGRVYPVNSEDVEIGLLLGRTATGAEAPTCEIAKKDVESFVWSCFAGLSDSGAKFYEFEISFDGEVLNSRRV